MTDQWGWVVVASDDANRPKGSRWIAVTDGYMPGLESYPSIDEIRIASWVVGDTND